MLANAPLERTKQGMMYRYRPLRLGRSDLEELLGIMKVSTGHRLDITADGYKLNNADDLSKLTERVISDFDATLYSSDGVVSIRFGPSTAEVYVSDIRNNELMGITQRIRDYLSANGGSVVMKLAFLGVGASLYAAALAGGVLLLNSTAAAVIYYVAVTIVAGAWFAWAHHVELNRHVLIYMTDEGRKSFLGRNSDQLILVLISAVVSAAFTLAATLVIQAATDGSGR